MTCAQAYEHVSGLSYAALKAVFATRVEAERIWNFFDPRQACRYRYRYRYRCCLHICDRILCDGQVNGWPPVLYRCLQRLRVRTIHMVHVTAHEQIQLEI